MNRAAFQNILLRSQYLNGKYPEEIDPLRWIYSTGFSTTF